MAVGAMAYGVLGKVYSFDAGSLMIVGGKGSYGPAVDGAGP